MDEDTAWAILGLSADASPGEARKAWKRRSLLLHPDRHLDADPSLQEEATRAAAQLNEAWTVVNGSLAARSEKISGLGGSAPSQAERESTIRSQQRRQNAAQFLVDAVGDAVEVFDHRPLPVWVENTLGASFSAASDGLLNELRFRYERAVRAAMAADAAESGWAFIDGLRLPSSWIEHYATLAELEDPPAIVALIERAG